MLLCDILVKKRGIILFPQGWMFFLESFQNGFHNCLTQKFRFVFYPVTVAVDTESSQFPVIKHQGKTISPP